MRITFPSNYVIPKVPEIVAENIGPGETLMQPPGEQIDGQWKAVHLGNRAMMKAEKPPKARQSRLVFGCTRRDLKHAG